MENAAAADCQDDQAFIFLLDVGLDMSTSNQPGG